MRKILIFISILFFANCNKPNTEVMKLVELLKTEKIIASYFQGNKYRYYWMKLTKVITIRIY